MPKDADAREEQEQHGFHHADPGETAQRGVLQQPRRSHQGQRVEKEYEPVGIHRRMSREEEEEGNDQSHKTLRREQQEVKDKDETLLAPFPHGEPERENEKKAKDNGRSDGPCGGH